MNTEQKINALREELRQHNYNYYVLDQPQISDYDFDMKGTQPLPMQMCAAPHANVGCTPYPVC